MTDMYTLFGNPVNHSYSPFIHQEFAKQTHQDLEYDKILIPSENDFESMVKDFFQQEN